MGYRRDTFIRMGLYCLYVMKQNVICRDCATLVDEQGRRQSKLVPDNYFVTCPQCGEEGKYTVDHQSSKDGYSSLRIVENDEQFAVVTREGAGMIRKEMGLV